MILMQKNSDRLLWNTGRGFWIFESVALLRNEPGIRDVCLKQWKIPEYMLEIIGGEFVYYRIIIVSKNENKRLIMIELFPNCTKIKYRLLLDVVR